MTPREREIADGVGDGLSYAEIGQHLGLKPTTVRTHVNAIARKLEEGDGRPLPPRWSVYTHVQLERWERTRKKN